MNTRLEKALRLLGQIPRRGSTYVQRKVSRGISHVRVFLPPALDRDQDNDRYLRGLRGKHAGEATIIIGNGPSLTVEDLTTIGRKRVLTFAFNKIFLAFENTPFRPDYYVVEDPGVALNTRREMEQLHGFPKLFPYDYRIELRNVPGAHFYYHDWTDPTPQAPGFATSPFCVHWGGSVVYSALQFAAYMGCSPIYLIGCDFSFVTPKQRDRLRPHVLISSGETNHFHPDYRRAGERWYVPRLDAQLLAFGKARSVLESRGDQVFNATRGGKLDVFERRDLDGVLAALPARSQL